MTVDPSDAYDADYVRRMAREGAKRYRFIKLPPVADRVTVEIVRQPLPESIPVDIKIGWAGEDLQMGDAVQLDAATGKVTKARVE